MCTDQAAALLAAVQPGRSAGVEGASALVQALTAGSVVAAGAAEEILVWVATVAGSPPAVRVAVLHSRGQRSLSQVCGVSSPTETLPGFSSTEFKACMRKLRRVCVSPISTF